MRVTLNGSIRNPEVSVKPLDVPKRMVDSGTSIFNTASLVFFSDITVIERRNPGMRVRLVLSNLDQVRQYDALKGDLEIEW